MSLPVHFPATRWSVVLNAVGAPEGQQAALEELCVAYWKPLYGFARMSGYSIEDSQDLLQGFVEKLLTSGKIGNPEQHKGKFRSYLLAAFKNFATDQWRKEGKLASRALRDAIALEPDFENQVTGDLNMSENLDEAFDKQWAETLMHRAVGKLRANYESKDKGNLFDQFVSYLGADSPSYAETSAAIGKSQATTRVYVQRFRNEFKKCIEEELSDTISNADDLESELSYLLSLLVK